MPPRKKKTERQKARNRVAKSHIVSEDTLREIHLKGYCIVRLSRIRYDDNPNPMIDIRLFQRGWGSDDGGEEVYHPTKKGIQMLESEFHKLVEAHFFESLDALIQKDPR